MSYFLKNALKKQNVFFINNDKNQIFSGSEKRSIYLELQNFNGRAKQQLE